MRHQTKEKSLKYNPAKSNPRNERTRNEKKCEEELLKIVSRENQDVRFSLNKKQRWKMVETLREQEKLNNTTSVYTETVKHSKSERFRAKFKGMKRDDFYAMRGQVFRDALPTRNDIIIEQNGYLLSTDKEKYK